MCTHYTRTWESVVCTHKAVMGGLNGFLVLTLYQCYNTTQAGIQLGIQASQMYILIIHCTTPSFLFVNH